MFSASTLFSMGLGKTLQAICLMSYIKVQRMSPGPFLILCPLSVTDGWVSEMGRFSPKLRVLRYVGDKDHRRNLRRTMYEHVKGQSSKIDVLLLPFDVLLTTYEIALMDQDFLSQIPWHYAVIDEAQRLKNPYSVLYNVLKERFLIPRRLLMTGTPIQNNLTELWSLMHFCMPLVFGRLDQFLFAFKEAANPSSSQVLSIVKEQLKCLKSIVGTFMLRRTKSRLIECGNLVLPPLTEITVMAPLVSLQKKVYMSILRRELPKLLAFSSGASNYQSLQNTVIQLRKACSHPYLFPGLEPEPYEEGEHLVKASGKLIILDQLLHKLHDSGHRVLLFAQMTHTLDILQDFLELRRYSYERLDGSVRAEERFAAIRSFSRQSAEGSLSSQAEGNGAFVFMISTRVGGVGLNLVAADTVIFYELDWNPQVDKQALQRAHRIGQMIPVLSISLVTEHTVEEVIMRRAERKLQLSHNVVGDDVENQENKESAGVEAGDLRSVIFGLGIFDPTEKRNDDIEELQNSELNSMVERIIAICHEQVAGKDGRKFEVNSTDMLKECPFSQREEAVSLSFGFDEASYFSWVEKFKEASKTSGDQIIGLGRRDLDENKHAKLEAAKKKVEDEKLLKWEALGYHSLSVKHPIIPLDDDSMLELGSVQFVYGDCTSPSNTCPSEPTIILSCVDDSGNWGRGGMFDALTKLSTSIPEAYNRASEFKDLHLGDLHLIRLNDTTHSESPITHPISATAPGMPPPPIKVYTRRLPPVSCSAPASSLSDPVSSDDLPIALRKENSDKQNTHRNTDGNTPQWVALAVVQSYNTRRKVPRSKISILDLECCISKASFMAAQNAASIHMPRIGYQAGSDRSEWYTIERLLRKYASIYGINFLVYYYRRPS
ncbi:probable helicase CHR10 isoform X2 [Humulus lupulus]|uniref:probable helicase CHR10 isoform X2 n=1 Tax=Humulus lupulus TaxID=3486 RepID=UPI002B412AC1|nr:probable helicase CHR10 isoform X2 [Humulus lupulus]